MVTASLPIPDELLACPDEPVPPDNLDDKALANWILDLEGAGAECRDKLSAIKNLDAEKARK